MSPATFVRCIKYIKSKYNVVLIENLAQKSTLRKLDKLATISFDTPVKELLDFAFPYLGKMNIEASLYVPTNCINNNTPPWPLSVLNMLSNTKVKTENIRQNSNLPKEIRELNLSGENNRYISGGKILQHLYTLNARERNDIIALIKSYLYDNKEVNITMLDWYDLNHLVSEGNYAGSLTRDYTVCNHAITDEDLINEFRLSGKEIENNLGYFPNSIAYPAGIFNEKTKVLARDAGYEVGLTLQNKKFNAKVDSAMEIPRIYLYEEGYILNRLRLAGYYTKPGKI